MPVLGRKQEGRLKAIPGNVPVPLNPPVQCGFSSRCLEKIPDCENGVPPMTMVQDGHFVRKGGKQMESAKALLEVKNLKKYYPIEALSH